MQSIFRIKIEREKYWQIACLRHQIRQISKCKTISNLQKLRILQHNCNRSTNVMQTIQEYAVKNANIVLLQES